MAIIKLSSSMQHLKIRQIQEIGITELDGNASQRGHTAISFAYLVGLFNEETVLSLQAHDEVHHGCAVDYTIELDAGS